MDNFLSFLRALLIFVGTFFVGHNLFGHAVDQNIWEIIGGIVISLGSMIWGIASKQSTYESVESTIRSVLTAASGLLVSWGVVASTTVNAVLAFIPALGVLIQSFVGKAKTVAIATGTATAQTNGKVASANQTVKTP